MLPVGSPSYDPTGGAIWEAMRTYQQRLDAFDQQALGGLARAYKEIQPDFQSAMATLQDKIRAAAASGLQPSASWVMQLERYRTLEQQVLASTARLGIMTGQFAEGEAAKALAAQNDFFAKLATGQASYGGTGDIRTWATLPERSLTSFMGLSQGSPLLAKFASEAGRDAMRAMRNTLASGIATGRPMRQTAKLMQARVAGLTLTRAQTITRTEVARARRAAALQTFQMNPAVRGWVWQSALDKACPACIALHGREFPTDEMQNGHPNCRCVMVPMRHRGVNPNVGTGGEWLARQPMDQWNRILGTGRANWLRSEMVRTSRTAPGLSMVGHIDAGLKSMVTLVPNRGWGGMYRPTSLRALQGRPAAPALPPPSPKGVPARVPIGDTVAERGRDALDDAAQKYASKYGLTPAEYKRQVNERIRLQLENTRLVMRRSERSAALIVQDGRFKSQFETGRSGGALSPSARATTENQLFKYPMAQRGASDTHESYNKVFPGHQRPVYGYAQPEVKDAGWYDGAQWYGNVQFVMKREVRGKTTWTSGDSLGGALRPGYFDDVDVGSVTRPTYGYAEAAASGARSYSSGTSDIWDWKVGTNGYTELQFHGGLFLDDVAEVILPGSRAMASTSLRELERLLTDRKVAFSWERDY